MIRAGFFFRRTATLCLGLLFLSVSPAAASAASTLNITVTSPWLVLLTHFIGGINVKVASILDWNDDGEPVRRIQIRSLRNLPPDSLIMAFDHRDAKGLGLPYGQYKNYRSLYDEMPLDPTKLDAFMSDPSVVPFIAQRVLTVLADWDPSGYPYYQRRLAEFQARLYSSVLAGRQVLKDQPVYDLTGHSHAFLQAAGCRLTRPTKEEWAAWSTWKEIDQLKAVVADKIENKIAVVVDYSTPGAIRSTLVANSAVFLMPRPRFDQDYPAFMHDQYISLWTKITSKPLPPPPKRR